jgi:hypothetical protein
METKTRNRRRTVERVLVVRDLAVVVTRAANSARSTTTALDNDDDDGDDDDEDDDDGQQSFPRGSRQIGLLGAVASLGAVLVSCLVVGEHSC